MLDIKKEAARCLLCADGACSKACSHGFDPSRMIRSVYFENEKTAAVFTDESVCNNCRGNCEIACVHYDKPIRIREMVKLLPQGKKTERKDLSIDFLGVHFENPFILSSSIVAGSYEMCASAFKAGWAGAAFKTIGFLKPREVSPRFDALNKESTPFIGFKNLEQISDHDLTENLNDLKRLKKDFPNKVIVASVMGRNEDEWTRLAHLVTEAGADIVECNFSCPQMCGKGLGSDVGQDPELVARYTAAVKKGTHLPVLAKMTPNIGHMEIPAIAAKRAGADGIAAINTVKSIMGLTLDCKKPRMDVSGEIAVSGYSGKAVKPIALRFISDMKHNDELKDMPISGMGGIETWHDAAEFMALGCGSVQVTTAVMQYGYRIIDDLLSGLSLFLEENGYIKLSDFVGAALGEIVSADELDRNSIVYPSFNKAKCVGCGRCTVSCHDAGHQALVLSGETHKPMLNPTKCVGCQLCALVCPVGCIGQSKRVELKASGY